MGAVSEFIEWQVFLVGTNEVHLYLSRVLGAGTPLATQTEDTHRERQSGGEPTRRIPRGRQSQHGWSLFVIQRTLSYCEQVSV